MAKKDAKIVTVQIKLPTTLLRQVEALIATGEFENTDKVMQSALDQFLATHSEEKMTTFIREDVAWGLAGDN